MPERNGLQCRPPIRFTRKQNPTLISADVATIGTATVTANATTAGKTGIAGKIAIGIISGNKLIFLPS